MVREHEFDERYFLQLQAIRDHWWVRGMQLVGAAMLDPERPRGRVLDAGCGAGGALAWAHDLADPLAAFGIDAARPAVDASRRLRLGTQLAVASATDLPFADRSFAIVLSFDVLQHLPTGDDARAASELARVLAPGGRALVRTNCAHGRSHVREHDHWRMYRPETLRAVLEDSGLEIDALTPVNFVQGLWSTLTRPRPRRSAEHASSSDDLAEEHRAIHGVGIPEPAPALKNRVLLQLLRAEAWFLSRRGRRLPFGHNLYAVARTRAPQDGSTATRSPDRADR